MAQVDASLKTSSNFDFFPVTVSEHYPKNGYLPRLPKDILLEIFKHLDFLTLVKIMPTNKRIQWICSCSPLVQKEMELCKQLAEDEFVLNRPFLLRSKQLDTPDPWHAFNQILTSFDSHLGSLTLQELAKEGWTYPSTGIITNFEKHFQLRLVTEWKKRLKDVSELVLDSSFVFHDQSFQAFMQAFQDANVNGLVIQCAFNHGHFLKFCEAIKKGLSLKRLTLQPSDYPSSASIKALIEALGSKNTKIEELNWKFSMTDSDSVLLKNQLIHHLYLRHLEVNCDRLSFQGIRNLMEIVKTSPRLINFHVTGLSSNELYQIFQVLNKLNIEALILTDPFLTTGVITYLAQNLSEGTKQPWPKIKLSPSTIEALRELLPKIPHCVMPISG